MRSVSWEKSLDSSLDISQDECFCGWNSDETLAGIWEMSQR